MRPTKTIDDKAVFFCGNAIDVLRKLPDKSVNCVVTSPPYWSQRNYSGSKPSVWGGSDKCKHNWQKTEISSKKIKHIEVSYAWCKKCGAYLGCLGEEPSPEQYIRNLVYIFDEIFRVLRDDGVCWVNLGDTYFKQGKAVNDMSSERSKYEFSKSKKVKRPKDYSSIKKIDKHEYLQNGSMVGIPWKFADAMMRQGWMLRSEVIWNKTNPIPETINSMCLKSETYPHDKGKKDTPYEFVDGSWRPTRCHEQLFMFTKTMGYYADGHSVLIPHSEKGDVNYVAWRTAYDVYAATGKLKGRLLKQKASNPRPNNHGRNRTTVWTMGYKAVKATEAEHTAPYPLDLADTCIKASVSPYGCCPKCGTPYARKIVFIRGKEYDTYVPTLGIEYNGWGKICSCKIPKSAKPEKCVVLDPFNGSGTTGIAALTNNCRYIGIDISKEYINSAVKRIVSETSGEPKQKAASKGNVLAEQLELKLS